MTIRRRLRACTLCLYIQHEAICKRCADRIDRQQRSPLRRAWLAVRLWLAAWWKT